jgi:hypothetical protein
MFRSMLLLLVSQLGWWSAMLIGFLHRHVQTIINYPDTPYLISGLILTAILIIWATGEMLLRAKKSV